MQKILVLFAHPALQKSRVNKILIRVPQQLEGVTFRDLYELYPEFDIDVHAEQNLLLDHDIIVFHHPFFWYSTPAILKEWQDLVLEHGWAYGRKGEALRGKVCVNVITTGGREEAYQKGGYNRFTVRELLTPIEQTAYLCGMRFLPPFIVHGTHQMQVAEMEQHADSYREFLSALRDGKLNLNQVDKMIRINQNLQELIET